MVALSSGEAEVYSAVCGLSRLIGVSNVLKEMRSECWGEPMEHAVDASTCKSILLRRGPGGMKHLDTKQLSVQEAITEKRIRVLKINREENPADTLASYSSAVAGIFNELRLAAEAHPRSETAIIVRDESRRGRVLVTGLRLRER